MRSPRTIGVATVIAGIVGLALWYLLYQDFFFGVLGYSLARVAVETGLVYFLGFGFLWGPILIVFGVVLLYDARMKGKATVSS